LILKNNSDSPQEARYQMTIFYSSFLGAINKGKRTQTLSLSFSGKQP